MSGHDEQRPDDVAWPMAADIAHDPSSRSERLLRLLPLLSMALAAILSVVVLPSSLNVTQLQPTQTLELAPVVPESSDAPLVPSGNVSSLALAQSGSPAGTEFADASSGDDSLAGALPTAVSENVSTYRCVDGRQTEDPLSPPCVAFFEGDNFGASYQGVTRDAIDILVYVDGNVAYTGTSRGAETTPTRTHYDLSEDAPEADEHVVVRMLRGWQQYFNGRYQTYGRRVRFHVYFSDSERLAEYRRADAVESFALARPFATIVAAPFNGGGDAYADTMLRRGVLGFGSFLGESAALYRRYPKLLWGYAPSADIQALQFSEVLCTNYLGDPGSPHPVDHAPDFAGQPRTFGLLSTTDPGFDGLRELKDQVVANFEACGGTLAETATFPQSGFAVSAAHGPSYAVDAMSRFQAAGVTTIIWPGGFETKFSQAAATLGYRPEWIVAGDSDHEAEQAAAFQDPTVWANAVVVSNQTSEPADRSQRICIQAYRTIDPTAPAPDVDGVACSLYPSLRQLFTGIQVAGPRLGPTSIDEGFHAIPAVASDNAQVPACFYRPDDYTCVKDVVVARFDPTGHTGSEPGATGGCYRVAAGRRFLLGQIPPGNATASMAPDDPCLGYRGAYRTSRDTPEPGSL